MLKALLAGPIALLFLLSACSKDGNAPSSTAIRIEGFDLFDTNGVYISHYGAHDKDWHFDDSLSPSELRLLDFQTPFDLKHTVPSIIRQNMLAYPIPCYHSISLNVQAPDSVLLKLVIVDSNLNVLSRYSFKIKGSWNNSLSLDDADFPAGASRRFYFSASAEHAPDFQVGFGDIKICDEISSGFSSCF